MSNFSKNFFVSLNQSPLVQKNNETAKIKIPSIIYPSIKLPSVETIESENDNKDFIALTSEKIQLK